MLLASRLIGSPGRSAIASMSSGPQWSSATASHILFRGSDASQQAAQSLAEIEMGARFEDMAAALSACPSGKRSGGSLGSFAPGKMVPAFDAIVFDASTLLDHLYMVETSNGMHILRVNSRTVDTRVHSRAEDVRINSRAEHHLPERGPDGYVPLSITQQGTETRDPEPSIGEATRDPQSTAVAGGQPDLQTAMWFTDFLAECNGGAQLAPMAYDATTHPPVHPATARLWAMQQGERDAVMQLLAQKLVGPGLRDDEAAELQHLLASLIATLTAT